MKIQITSIIVALCIQSVVADDSVIKKNIELCNNKDNDACYNVGEAYFWGDGAKKDYKKASEYYDKSCLLQHLIGCAALSYMTPLLQKKEFTTPSQKKDSAPKQPKDYNLLKPQDFEYARAEFSNINSDKFRKLVTRKYQNFSKEKIDLLRTADALLTADKRFAWVVYQDLKKNNLLKADLTQEEFWSIFTGRAYQIVDYLLVKYHYVLSDEEIDTFLSSIKERFIILYEKKNYNTCKKLVFEHSATEEELLDIFRESSTELLRNKLQAQSNLIKTVLYKNENELNNLKNKYAYLDKPESDDLYKKIRKKTTDDYVDSLSKQDIDSFIEVMEKEDKASAESVCKWVRVFHGEFFLNGNRDVKEKRLIFVKSYIMNLADDIALDNTMTFIDDEIKTIKQDESIIDREYLSNQKKNDEKKSYEHPVYNLL